MQRVGVSLQAGASHEVIGWVMLLAAVSGADQCGEGVGYELSSRRGGGGVQPCAIPSARQPRGRESGATMGARRNSSIADARQQSITVHCRLSILLPPGPVTMRWIVPSAKNPATATREKRLWVAADELCAHSDPTSASETSIRLARTSCALFDIEDPADTFTERPPS